METARRERMPLPCRAAAAVLAAFVGAACASNIHVPYTPGSVAEGTSSSCVHQASPVFNYTPAPVEPDNHVLARDERYAVRRLTFPSHGLLRLSEISRDVG